MKSQGECRSHDEEKLAHVAAAMVDALQEGAARDRRRCRCHSGPRVPGLRADRRAPPVVRLSKAAVSAIGLEPRLLTGGGGSDANILNARGLPTVNLDAGMMQVHSPDEYLTLDDLDRLCALVLQMIMLAPGFAPRAESLASLRPMTDRRDQADAGTGEEETEPLPGCSALSTGLRGQGGESAGRRDRAAQRWHGRSARSSITPGRSSWRPSTTMDHVYLVRQYRHPIGRYLLELPAGGLEPGEEPLAAAKRELREEVGLEAREWTSLGSFFSSPGFANERLHAFLARGLVRVPSRPG